MAERRKTQRKAKNPASGTADAKPEAETKLETEAKREAESKSGAKGRGGSKQAKKAEEKGAAQAEKKAAAKPKASASKGKSTGAKATSKTAGTKAAEKSKAPAKGKSTAKKPAAAKKAAPKKDVERPVVNARARYVRVAPRKARLIADQVRGMTLEDAETLLRFSPRSAAGDIAKLLASAAANAENNHDLVADDLVIKDIRVDEGPTLRRYRPRALGRATKINKRTSHIHVALTPEES